MRFVYNRQKTQNRQKINELNCLNMKKRVLLSAPTSKHKDYCMRDWIKWITSKDFSEVEYDILIVDNSKDRDYKNEIIKQLGDKGVVLRIPYEKGRNIYQTMSKSLDLIRTYFLRGDYDFLFTNESDVFVPKKTIDYLVSLKKSVIGLPYFIGQHYQSLLISHHIIRAGYNRSVNINILNKSFLEFDGKIKKDKNTGLGALMIHKGIVEKTNFNIKDDEVMENAYPDTYFQNKIEQLGVDIWQVKKYMALHLNKDWNEVHKNLKNE